MAYKDPEVGRQRSREYYIKNRHEVNARRRARYAQNPEKTLAYARDWYARNKDRAKLNGKMYRARHRHDLDNWWEMWDAQDGRCYLCGDALSEDRCRTHIDHDHSCHGRGYSCRICRRGLACMDCNISIGHAHDDPARLRRMADALEAAQVAFRERRAFAGQEQLPLLLSD